MPLTPAVAKPSTTSFHESSLVGYRGHPDILWGQNEAGILRVEVLADILEATAARLPNQFALLFGKQTRTYDELNTQADQIASHLIETGVRPGDIVGLWMPRGIGLLTAQAGIAKAGAAWLPFDADTPVERITVCLADAKAAGLVSCQAFEARMAKPLALGLDQLALLLGKASQLSQKVFVAQLELLGHYEPEPNSTASSRLADSNTSINGFCSLGWCLPM